MEKEFLAEGKFGTGCLPQIEDERDLRYSATGPFDWDLGFDIELLLGFRTTCATEGEFWGLGGREGWGVNRYREIVEECKKRKIARFKIPIKNQGASSSCTGQGLTYYLSVLNFIETGKWVEISARDVYAYIALSGGGAYLRDALALACDRGIATEELVPCYHRQVVNNREFIDPYSEKEYLVKPEETFAVKAVRNALQSKEFELIKGEVTMDKMAWAMLMNFGVYFAVDGENNGTWTNEFPQPPTTRKWGHALFGGVAKKENSENIIGFPNSWGTVGVNGWQKLKNNYYLAGAVNSPWTLTDKNNNMANQNTNAKIIKDTNSPAVGIWLPALSQEALESLCLNFGIPIPKKPDGSIDWNAWIDGTLILQ